MTQVEHVTLSSGLTLDKPDKKEIRKDILDFEELLSTQEGVFFGDSDNCPLTHFFSPGMYVRQIFIPAGTYIVGKLHRHKHPNFLMKGSVNVITESKGIERLEGPLTMISEAGTKRALYAVTDLLWVTCHLNKSDTTDLAQLEKEIIAPNYEEYEMSLLPWYKKVLVNIKTLLS